MFGLVRSPPAPPAARPLGARSNILQAYSTCADPLLKNVGAQEVPDEEMWRDRACAKALLLARYISSAVYFLQGPSSAVCAFARGVCVCVCERERERERERVSVREREREFAGQEPASSIHVVFSVALMQLVK